MSSLTTGTTTGTAAVLTADTTGDCVIKTGSSATTAMTISGSTQAVTLAAGLTGTTANMSGAVTLGSSVLATPTGSAPSFTCRAWVNFNGTGTVSIRASGNASSLVDNGVGDYTVNFTTAMPDANYAVNTSASDLVTTGRQSCPRATSTASVRVVTGDTPGLFTDYTYVSVSIFR